MEQYNSYNTNNSLQNEDTMSIQQMVDFIWRLKYWIIGCAFVCCCCAFFYLRMQTKIYERSTIIMLNGNDGSNTELSLLQDLTGNRSNKRIENEIFILQTPTLSKKVVEELDLNYRYYRFAKPFRDRPNKYNRLQNRKKTEYYLNNPFSFSLVYDELLPSSMKLNSLYVEFKALGNGRFKITDISIADGVHRDKIKIPEPSYEYGQTVTIETVSFTVNSLDESQLYKGCKYAFSWKDPYAMGKSIIEGCTVAAQGAKNTTRCDVIKISMNDSSPRRAEDFLNCLVNKANDEARYYASQASLNSIEFIDSRLQTIAKDLANAESDYKSYQRTNTLVDLTTQSSATISQEQQYRNKLTDVELQIQLLDMVRGYLVDGDNEYKVVPADLGLSDNALNSVLSNYNTLVAERNRMLNNSSLSNPRVVTASSQLDELKKSIIVSIDNLDRVYNITRNELKKSLSSSLSRMTAIPQQQFELQQISRKLDIIEPLYLLLQQKREEIQIQMYSGVDNYRILEVAYGSGVPVSPSSRNILLFAFILGCIIPPGLVYLRMQLRTAIETKEDVEKVIKDVPVVAMLPKAESDNRLVNEHGRDSSTESFRMLRSNLKYLKDAKVIQVTSSLPVEGKTYVAVNLALSLSHLGKKVIVVGMDIRKPALNKILKRSSEESSKSVVGFLVGKTTDVTLLPHPSGVSATLDYIPAGPIPPNPTELLDQKELETLINFCRENYDYVIIDSAPWLPVPDSSIINRFVDATLYVIRAQVTRLDLLPAINDYFKSETAPFVRPNIVINDVNVHGHRYQYGYGKGYGYGYGYGYGRHHGYGYGYGYGYGDGSTTTKQHGKKHHSSDSNTTV